MEQPTITAPPGQLDRVQSARQLTAVLYVLYAVGLFSGLPAFIALVINYVKRNDTAGTIYRSHFSWQIRSFWWGLIWGVLGMATVVIGVGFLVLAVNWLWLVYRLVRGFLNWNDGKRMPV